MTELGANGVRAEAIGSEVRIVTFSNANPSEGPSDFACLCVSVANSSLSCLVHAGLSVLYLQPPILIIMAINAKILLINFHLTLLEIFYFQLLYLISI